jgi:cold shock CspA family protein/ribosome-associated translation inhibitor RaiA
MQIPLDISFRHVEHSPAIEAEIRKKAEQLETFFDRITGCSVVIEAPHHHHQKGSLYHVRLRIAVPHKEIVVDREPSAHHAHEDVHVTIRDAFKEARRQLQDYARQLRGDVKTHESAPGGVVTKLLPEEGYGFIEAPDGREVYFHANSVLDVAFEEIGIGSEVRFVEEVGEKGPQATSVRIVGRHHHLVE